MITPIEELSQTLQAVERCRAKQRYRTKQDALARRDLLLDGHHGRHLPSDLTVYPCPVCRRWHLVKRPPFKTEL
jgi:hypothetical protein